MHWIWGQVHPVRSESNLESKLRYCSQLVSNDAHVEWGENSEKTRFILLHSTRSLKCQQELSSSKKNLRTLSSAIGTNRKKTVRKKTKFVATLKGTQNRPINDQLLSYVVKVIGIVSLLKKVEQSNIFKDINLYKYKDCLQEIWRAFF